MTRRLAANEARIASDKFSYRDLFLACFGRCFDYNQITDGISYLGIIRVTANALPAEALSAMTHYRSRRPNRRLRKQARRLLPRSWSMPTAN